MADYKSYLKIKNILDIVSNGDRIDPLARTLRAVIDVKLLEKMQEYIKQTKIEEMN